jgi:toxin ParE1/3/4
MTLSVNNDAAAEIEAAALYYKQFNLQTALRFQEAVREAFERIAAHPDRYPVRIAPYRVLQVRHFPYTVTYRQVDGGVRVLAVSHHRRKPLYWDGRQ